MTDRILVVDDDERTREMVASFLEGEGYDCITADDGLRALELLAGNAFDVVVSDVRMPNLDGISLVQRVQEIDTTLPVVLVTGESVFDTAVLAVQHGAFDYIVKPFSIQELTSAVTRALAKRAELQAALTSTASGSSSGIAIGEASSNGHAPCTHGDEIERLREAAEALRQTVNAAVDEFLAGLE